MLKKGLILGASILASFGLFVLAWVALQYYVTRNLPGDASEIPKLCLNFAVAGLIGGVIYAIIRRHGIIFLAAIPSMAIGALFVIRGATDAAVPLAVGIFTGIISGPLGAYLTKRAIIRL